MKTLMCWYMIKLISAMTEAPLDASLSPAYSAAALPGVLSLYTHLKGDTTKLLYDAITSPVPVVLRSKSGMAIPISIVPRDAIVLH